MRPRNAQGFVLVLVLAMLVPVVSAQQLAQPPAAPTLTLPSETTLGTSNGSQLRQAVAAPSVLSDPAQRAGSTARVAEKGPSNAPPMPKEPPQPLPKNCLGSPILKPFRGVAPCSWALDAIKSVA